MPFRIQRNDISRMSADAIVNAANSRLAAGSGVCGAIFRAAGHEELQRACDAIGHCDVGSAVVTPAFRLKAKYVIHAVGPIWRGGDQNEEALLRSCYCAALSLAEQNGCTSIAFPLISSGVYGYPKDEAFRVAVSTIRDFLSEHEMDVILVVFDRGAVTLSEQLCSAVTAYIDDHYVETHRQRRRNDVSAIEMQAAEQDNLSRPIVRSCKKQECLQPEAGVFGLTDDRKTAKPKKPKKVRKLEEVVSQLDESFNHMLLRLIDEKGMTDSEVYKRANLDRRLFSKLRKEGHTPAKSTAVALAIALRLNVDETADFLARAGYALSSSSKSDVIVRYFIENGQYDIDEINATMFYFEQKLLGTGMDTA